MPVRPVLHALAAVAVAVGLAMVPVAAHAEAPEITQAYRQKCTDIGNGTLCIDITGSEKQNGVIGVGYWKHSGAQVRVQLGWQNTEGGLANMHPEIHTLGAGGSTGTQTTPTYLAPGCVYPILKVLSSPQTTILGQKACVPVE
ncbi:hypothetical protein [Streptomyces beigongshangae]|uniref:hypothetical protein n=1 Tax=Streptomyces beigongshangae TaxID=2841597 RepID=UPI001C84C563|nr:hypothetical protein [Streptomyces sp. REN17]